MLVVSHLHPFPKLRVFAKIEPLTHALKIRSSVQSTLKRTMAFQGLLEDIAHFGHLGQPPVGSVVGNDGERDQRLRIAPSDLLP